MSSNENLIFSYANQTIEICLNRNWSFLVRSPSSSYVTSSVVACVVNALFCVIGTILNSLVSSIFWKSKKMRKKIPYFMIMVLSSTDLAVVIIAQPLFLLHSLNEILGTAKCMYAVSYRVAMTSLSGISAVTLFVMNIERYLAITHPIFHRVTVTKGKCLLMSTLCWFVIISLVTVRFISKFVAHVFSLLAFIVCVTSLFTYLSIYYAGRKSLFKVRSENNAFDANATRNFMRFLRELKMLRTYFLIVFLCFVCYLPAAVVFGLWDQWFDTENTRHLAVEIPIWADTFVLMTSTLNCIVFFWANKQLNKEGWKLLKRFFGQQKSWNAGTKHRKKRNCL